MAPTQLSSLVSENRNITNLNYLSHETISFAWQDSLLGYIHRNLKCELFNAQTERIEKENTFSSELQL
jgi:hypothetical protein